jgi:pimeloyl-ACP methyl ester carboxylesterase
MNIQIQDITIEVTGSGTELILMLHGWPDTLALWDGTVNALKPKYRCARLTLPGFESGPQAVSLDAMCSLLLQVADHLSPDKAITLLLHDWGCAFGYEFAMHHPQRVARVIALDIGDHNAPALRRQWGLREKLAVAAYQVWLALAWKIGGAMGTSMTRVMARTLRAPAPSERITYRMNYPYAMRWFGSAGGFARSAQVQLPMPLLYVYGKRKPFMFHSQFWLDKVAKAPGNAVLGLPCGHWLMLDQAEAFHAAALQWLAQSGTP